MTRTKTPTSARRTHVLPSTRPPPPSSSMSPASRRAPLAVRTELIVLLACWPSLDWLSRQVPSSCWAAVCWAAAIVQSCSLVPVVIRGSSSAGSGACWPATGSTGCAGRPGGTPRRTAAVVLWTRPRPTKVAKRLTVCAGQGIAPTTSIAHSGELPQPATPAKRVSPATTTKNQVAESCRHIIRREHKNHSRPGTSRTPRSRLMDVYAPVLSAAQQREIPGPPPPFGGRPDSRSAKSARFLLPAARAHPQPKKRRLSRHTAAPGTVAATPCRLEGGHHDPQTLTPPATFRVPVPFRKPLSPPLRGRISASGARQPRRTQPAERRRTGRLARSSALALITCARRRCQPTAALSWSTAPGPSRPLRHSPPTCFTSAVPQSAIDAFHNRIPAS